MKQSTEPHNLSLLSNEEEKDRRIRACVICPGEVETPIIDQRPEPVGPANRARMLQPEDVAAAALFVASLPPRACIPELILNQPRKFTNEHARLMGPVYSPYTRSRCLGEIRHENVKKSKSK